MLHLGYNEKTGLFEVYLRFLEHKHVLATFTNERQALRFISKADSDSETIN